MRWLHSGVSDLLKAGGEEERQAGRQAGASWSSDQLTHIFPLAPDLSLHWGSGSRVLPKGQLSSQGLTVAQEAEQSRQAGAHSPAALGLPIPLQAQASFHRPTPPTTHRPTASPSNPSYTPSRAQGRHQGVRGRTSAPLRAGRTALCKVRILHLLGWEGLG